MKALYSFIFGAAVCSFLTAANPVFAQGTAFAYQGRLNNGTNPANGSFDMTFSLYNASSGGIQFGSTLTTLAVGVTNGLFIITNDFGAVYNGTPYWLQISVRTNGGGTFSPLSPRQAVMPTPYSVYAESAGSTALLSDTGSENFFAGQSAGNSVLTGAKNTGVGFAALASNAGGDFNTATGASALTANTGGNANTANGFLALQDNQSGGNNTAIGADTLSFNVSGGGNTATGVGALEDTTVSENTAYGFAALNADTTGSNNVAMGYGALQNSKTDHDLVAIGYEALQNDNALNNGVTGSGTGENTAIGYEALLSDTSGSGNTSVGYESLNDNTSGYQNTGIGDSALGHNTSGVGNTAVGYDALFLSQTANYNTATGFQAMTGPVFSSPTGNNNTADGAFAMTFETTGSNNVAVGANALQVNSTGSDNVAVGSGAMTSTTGGGNVAVGVSALQANVSGGENTALGSAALFVSTGTGNIAIGNGAGDTLTNGNNNIYIGNGGHTSESGVIRIGVAGTHFQTSIAGTSVGINMSTPTAALDVNGEFMVAEGLGGVRCYLGDDGGANGVEVGSLVSGNTMVTLYNEADHTNMSVTCASITITGGSDLAEPFPIATQDQKISAGTVMVIDEQNPGRLKMSDQPYDSHVAGVVSGANGITPGIQMQQQGLLEGGRNVALTGRVYVQADASNGAIKPGDLLTTSSTPGRAMRVTNHTKAQGAILGKAMTGLKAGQGMVLVLVTLQ